MPKFRVEVFAPEKREDDETDTYPIPDPSNWEAYYAQLANDEVTPIQTVVRSKRVYLDKPVVLHKGKDAVELVVNDHLLKYLQADRNIRVRVLGEFVEQSPAKAIEKIATKKTAARKQGSKPVATKAARKVHAA
jgi:hypothetical protein